MDRQRDEPDSGDAARDSRERLLNGLVGQYVDRINAGEAIDRSRIALDHPELAAEILGRLGTFEALGPRIENEGFLKTFGGYQILRQVGRGGMGIVYEAWQSYTDRRVALKVLPAPLLGDSKAVSRFLREAQIAGQLQHPSIVPVYSAGVEDQNPFFAMEYVEGETLAQIVVRLREAKSEARTVFGYKDQVDYFAALATAFAEVADGLHHAHSKGVVHRDVKPSNLILDTEADQGAEAKCRLRILDFGLAHFEGQESLTISGDIVGTPSYMSPEQARRQKIPIDHRTDIYSLGATLCEFITLEQPFRGKDHADTLSQIIERDPVEPRKANPRVPRDLEMIVLKCLRKDAGERYRTAEALGQDLRRFVRGEPIEARPEGRWQRLARRGRRHRIRLGVAAVLVVLLLVIGWLAWSQGRERRLRALADYPPAVLRALEKLQAGSLCLRAESGDLLSIDPRGRVFGGPWVHGLSGQTMPPLEAAVRELGDAIALVPNKPDAWYHRARGRYLLADLDGALADLDRALRASPSFVPASMLQGAIHDLRGEKDTARQRREKALSVGSGWQQAWLSAREAMAEKRWEDAAKAFGDLIHLGAVGEEPYIGATIESCLARAGAMLELKETIGALQHIAVARYLWPASVEPALLEGKAFWLLGDVEKAEAVFQRTYDEAPYKDEVAVAVLAICRYFQDEDRAFAWAQKVQVESARERLRAGSLLETRRCSEAVQAARRAIALDPRDVYAHVYLAVTLYDCLGKFEEAMALFEAALELAPESTEVHFQLGRCFWFWGKLGQAEEHYRRAIGLDPTNAIAQADLGLVLILQGKREQGETLLKDAVAMDPWNPYVHHDRAIGLELVGREREALAACEDAIRVNAQLSWPYGRRGEIFEKEGKLDEAVVEYRKACTLTPREISHWQRLGRILEVVGKPEEAFAEYLEAIDMDLTNAWTHCRVAQLLRKHGLAVAGKDAARLGKLLDGALEKALQDLDAAESPASDDGRLVASLVWMLSSLQAIRARDHDLVGLLPRLPPYAAIDALLASDKLPARPRSESATTSSRAEYLQAKLLDRSGHRLEAAAKLAELVALDPTSPEPVLALATCLRLDDPTRAESELRKALAVTTRGTQGLWDLWAAVCLQDLRRDPGGLLESLPAASPAAAADGEDLRWLLAKLRDGTAIRVDCGGEDTTSPDSNPWSRDRFFTGGRTVRHFVGEIAGTDADPLYHAQRCFPEELVAFAGYRLPVPSGRYRIQLHFAEVYWRVPGVRRFDVRIEGERVVDGYEPIARGFAAAVVESFVTAVDDGQLDIELVAVADVPIISAIEIERAD